MHRQIAGKLTGPVIKWFVLAVWLVLGIGSSVLGSKLIDVQDNQASSWLPGNAESTKALAKLEAFQSQNAIPTTVVYERTDGLSAADLAASQGRRAAVRRHRGRHRQGDRPDPVQGRPGRADAGHVQLRQGRVEQDARRRRRAAQDRRSTA